VKTVLVTRAVAGWTDDVGDIAPGAHLAVEAEDPLVAIEGRLSGFELRDTILVLRPGPKSSFCFLFRKPLREPTVADQMAETNTGAMNVDGCRVSTTEDRGRPRGTFPHSDDTWGNGHLKYTDSHDGGRWPPNVVLVHGPGCRQTGTRRVAGINQPGSVGGRRHSTGQRYAQDTYSAAYERSERQSYADEDGLETIAPWNCEPGCPVALLDQQSGVLLGAYRSSSLALAKMDEQKFCEGAHNTYGKGLDTKPAGTLYTDSGGASRFYPQFTDEDELRTWITTLASAVSSGEREAHYHVEDTRV
jgi:hypothetical protein